MSNLRKSTMFDMSAAEAAEKLGVSKERALQLVKNSLILMRFKGLPNGPVIC